MSGGAIHKLLQIHLTSNTETIVDHAAYFPNPPLSGCIISFYTPQHLSAITTAPLLTNSVRWAQIQIRTMGLAPRTRYLEVIEEAPSHDGAPCISIWENYNDEDEPHSRPKYAIQFYDTTPSSRDPQHLKAVTQAIHRATEDTRTIGGVITSMKIAWTSRA